MKILGWLCVVEMLFLKLVASTAGCLPTMLAIITVLAAYFYRAVAFPAIYRSAFSGFKRHFGCFSAARTGSRKHLALWLVTGVTSLRASGALSFFAGCPACRTAFRFIGITLGSKKLLFLNGERERSSTIKALDWLFLKTHWMTSSLNIVRVLVISTINLLGL